MLEPMSFLSICGQERLSSSPSAPSAWHAFASSCQLASSLSLPEPAIIEAMSTFEGYSFLTRAIRGTHQSSVLSEISSQFQEECNAVPGRFLIERYGESGVARMNLVFGPRTFT